MSLPLLESRASRSEEETFSKIDRGPRDLSEPDFRGRVCVLSFFILLVDGDEGSDM